MTSTFKPIALGRLNKVDIIKPFHYYISEEDQKAWQCDPWECIAANGLNRQPGITHAQFGAELVYFDKKGIPMRARMPHNIRAMIKAYDDQGLPLPVGIRIDLVPPQPSNRLGARTKPTSRIPRKMQAKGKPTKLRQRTPSTRNIFVKPPHDNS